MKRYTLIGAAFLGLLVLVSGCSKKIDSTSITGAGTSGTTGFDSLATTDELAQLPQANTAVGTPNQQAGIETLPIEAAPVTQAVNQGVSGAIGAVDSAVSAAKSVSNNHAKEIQTALKNAGLYSGSIDGKIGPGTKRAIETFQKNNGLKADGKVGPKTWKALEAYLSGQAASSQVSGSATTSTVAGQ